MSAALLAGGTAFDIGGDVANHASGGEIAATSIIDVAGFGSAGLSHFAEVGVAGERAIGATYTGGALAAFGGGLCGEYC